MEKQLISFLLVGVCALILAKHIPQCQGAKYVNSLDLNDEELSILLDELTLPQHRLIKDKPMTFSWFSLKPEASSIKNSYYEFEKPSSRRRRIVKKQRRVRQ